MKMLDGTMKSTGWKMSALKSATVQQVADFTF